MATSSRTPQGEQANRALTQALLGCGPLYAVTYVIVNDVVAPTFHDRYSRLDQAVSELSAIGSPSSAFIRAMLPVFTALMLAFGIGVWRAAQGQRALRVTAAFILGSAVVGVMWLWFPMTSRADLGRGPMTVNDVGHLVLSGLTVLLILLRMGFGAAALGTRFRVFTALCAFVLLGFGGWMSALAPGVSEGTTPWMGLAERVMLGAWLAWDSALCVVLIRSFHRSASLTARGFAR